MEKSASLKELATALNKFQGKMGIVPFDSNNPFFKSKYASLSTIVSTAKPILAECGLSVSQLTEGEGGVTTILMHESGEYISSTLTLKAVKDDPQGHGSAITYARRYAYAAILGIVSDEDDDGNEATQPKANAHKSSPSTQAVQDPKDIVFITDEDKITEAQQKSLGEMLVRNGYSVDELKTFISWEFNLEKLSQICNKHVPAIQKQFGKKKAVAQ